MSNPFEDENGTYLALANAEEQHSLWPVFADVPAGWRIVHGPAGRAECLDHIAEHWVDMRPKSLIDAMRKPPAPQP